MVVAPILLLLMMQIQFLPFHSSFITWTHRTALFVDLILVWWLWRKILSGRETNHPRRHPSRIWTIFGLTLSATAFLFSWATATFPGESQDGRWPNLEVFPATDRVERPIKVSLHDWIFNGTVNDTTSRRKSPFSSTLVLTGLNIDEGLGIVDPEKAKWRDYIFRARGRDLRGAILDFATLPKVDFEGAELQGASFRLTGLGGAEFVDARLQGANFEYAQLRGTLFDRAQLQAAVLGAARLQGASLHEAQLQGATLKAAQLQGASLVGAKLHGASLFDAQLQGARLDFAELQGASFFGAQLQGASLFKASLLGASLDGAALDGESLEEAQLQGASLRKATVKATDFSNTLLWRTDFGAPSSDDVAALATVNLSDENYKRWYSFRTRGGPSSRVFRPDQWLAVWRHYDEVQSWSNKAYRDLYKTMESIPREYQRRLALNNIHNLDPSLPQAPEADAWRKSVERARVEDKTYVAALTAVLKALVCSGDDDASDVLRGLITPDSSAPVRLAAAGSEAPQLINMIMSKDSKDCAVAGSLTNADRANLRRIKQEIEKPVN